MKKETAIKIYKNYRSIRTDRHAVIFAIFATIILLARNFLPQYLHEIVINVIEINFIKLGENNMREFV